MNTKNDKATPRPWRLVERSSDCTIQFGIEHPMAGAVLVVCDFFTPTHDSTAGFVCGAQLKSNAALIVRAVNEYDALNAIAEAATKLEARIKLWQRDVAEGVEVIHCRIALESALSTLTKLRE